MVKLVQHFLSYAIVLMFMGNAYASCDKIKIAFSENWYPVSFNDEAGKPIGIGIDTHREIFSNLGIEVEFIPNLPWTRQLKRLETGHLDALTGVNFNKERAEKYLLSDKYYEFNVRLFALKENDIVISDVQDLAQYGVAYSRGASYGHQFNELAKKHENIIPVNGTDTIIEVLNAKRVDFIVLPEILGQRLVTQAGYKDKISMTGPIIHRQAVHFAFSRKSECGNLQSAYDQELQKMKSTGFAQKILENYEKKN